MPRLSVPQVVASQSSELRGEIRSKLDSAPLRRVDREMYALKLLEKNSREGGEQGGVGCELLPSPEISSRQERGPGSAATSGLAGTESAALPQGSSSGQMKGKWFGVQTNLMALEKN